MWEPGWSTTPDEDWRAWDYLHGGPSARREFEARRHARHDVDFARGRNSGWDVDPGAQWSMGNPGNWATVAPYSGAPSSPGGGMRGYAPHLGHLGPPILSPAERAWGRSDEHGVRTYGPHFGLHRGRGPKGYKRSDARILEDVCEALMFDADVDAVDIEVKVDDGEVVLEGTVGDRRQKRLAEDACDAVPGVRDVINRLRVAAAADASSPRRSKTG